MATAGRFEEEPDILPSSGGCMGGGKPKVQPPTAPPPFSSAASEKVKVSKVVVIYNPVSGKRLGEKLAETMVRPQLCAAGVEVDLRPTARAGHAVELARTLPLTGVDALVGIGGDGTLSEIVNGFMARASGSGSCPLGFIPGGTGNSVLTDLGLPKPTEANVTEAVKRIIVGETKKYDLIKVQGCAADGKTPAPTTWSLNILAWGLGTDANISAEGMRCLGPARYDVAILGEIIKFKQRKLKITIDGGAPIELPSCMLACLQNNKHTGAGLKCAPLAQLDDGLLDLWFGSPKSRGDALGVDADIKDGGKHVYNSNVQYHRCKRVNFETPEPTRYMIDGDVSNYTPVTTEVVPGAISIFF